MSGQKRWFDGPAKRETMMFRRKKKNTHKPVLFFDRAKVSEVEDHKHWGLTFHMGSTYKKYCY